MSKERVGTTKCGWCLTEDHDKCRVETSPWFGSTVKCSCPCPKPGQKPAPKRRSRKTTKAGG